MLLINLKKLKTRTKNILKEQSNDGSTKRHFTNNITIKNTLVTAFILETKFIDKISYRYLKLLPGAKLLYNSHTLSLCMYACVSQSQGIFQSSSDGIKSCLQEYLFWLKTIIK